jgi:hypothetical protein
MSFEQGWMSLHQILATRPDGNMHTGSMRGRAVGVSLQSRLHLPLIAKRRIVPGSFQQGFDLLFTQ